MQSCLSPPPALSAPSSAAICGGCLPEAIRHFDAGRPVVPCDGKRPRGRNWPTAWRDRDKLIAHFTRHPDDNLGLILGELIDIEWDDASQEQAFRELFAGVPIPRTPCFQSPRGWHYFFKADPRLTALGQGIINYKGLGIRIGGAKAAQTLIPPSRNPDGSQRRWEVSFDDCDAAGLPESVVDRVLAFTKKPTAPAAASSGPTTPAVAAMLRLNIEDANDGSKRLYALACRAVEHDLADADAIAAIREVEKSKPFPRQWSDDDILTRIRDAEKVTTRGLANAGIDLWSTEGRTDAANARRLDKMFGDSIRWCHPWRKWLVWDGCRWVIDQRCTIEAHAKAVARSLWTEFLAKGRENSEVYRFVRNSSNLHAIQAMEKLARSEPGLSIVPEQLDTDSFLLNVQNGTLDLRTGTLRPHSKNDYMTKLSPIEYDPAATCPVWLAFLDTVFVDDRELIGFVKRLLGYCLTGDVREQILTIFHGSGANGKSTLLNALLDICGDYAIKTTENLLLEKGSDGHPTMFADLAGRRVAIASETGDGARLAETRIKELTGGERIRARKMREDFSEFHATHKILLATNHRPRIKGTDHAIWRRIRLVPFDRTLAAAEQDKELPAKLKAEYAGILCWMIGGCIEWRQKGLGMPARVESATNKYRAEENVLGEFLAACCEIEPDASIGATELFHAFQQFTGDRSMSQQMLATVLHGQGFTNARMTRGPNKGRIAWHGLRLVPTE